MFKNISIFLIRIYQKTLSPDHGLLKYLFPNGYCKFYPSCSEYAVQALAEKKFLKANSLIASRLVRCNPWSKGGIDELE